MKNDLIQFKKNIISWYPIKKEDKVLQIGESEEIFNELKIKTNNVILANEVNEIEVQNTFDYVTLIGNLDTIESEQEIINLLTAINKMLNRNGKILIAMKNKFGMKYWTGEKSDEYSKVFESILSKKYLSINRIKNILNSLKLKYKFYYPLPDYNITNVIFTDNYLPTKDSIDARDLTYCREDELLVFSEREAYKQLIEECKEMFPFFANSFFIEVSEKDNFEDIKYVSYGITRNKKYRIKTIIGKNLVYKYPNNEDAKEHIWNISRNISILNECKINCLDILEDGKIVSKYLENAKSYDEILMEEYRENGLESVIQKIREFKSNILEKLLNSSEQTEVDVFEKYQVKLPNELKLKLHFTTNGVIDLIFQNCLVKGKELYAYDQEWYEANIPIEFILYRAVFYFTELKKIEDINNIYEKLDLQEYVKYFEELETKIQNNIVDESMWKMHINSTKNIGGAKNFIENYENKLNEANKHVTELENAIEQYKNSINELTNTIKEKDRGLEDYANQLRAISNSLSWKITKPIRQISGVLKKKK